MSNTKKSISSIAVTPAVSAGAGESCADGSLSALGPGAYLNALIYFLGQAFPSDYYRNDLRLNLDFFRPLRAIAGNPAVAEEPVFQVEVAIEVLERCLLGPQRTSRPLFYADIARPEASYPKPGVLGRMLDLALGELGTTRGELAGAWRAAYPASGTADRTALDALLARIKLVEADFTEGLSLSGADMAALESLLPGISVIDGLPALLRAAATRGIDPSVPLQLSAHEDAVARARAAMDRVKQQTLADVRANLLYAIHGGSRSDRDLGNELYIDLSTDTTVRTTRLADAIEALQAFVLSCQLGCNVNNATPEIPRAEFEARWRGLQSYSIWHAAQSVYHYPENVAFPYVRRDRTPQFATFLEQIQGAGPDGVLDAVQSYETAITQVASIETTQTATVDGRLFLFGYASPGALAVAEQFADYTWSGWHALNLPGERMVAAAGFNGRLYVFFRPGGEISDRLDFTWLDPDALQPAPLASTGSLCVSFGHIGNVFGAVAGTDHLAVYFSLRENEHSFFSGVMNRHHQWRTVLQAHDNPVDHSARVLGHVDGSDYLLTSEQTKLWLVRVERPTAIVWESAVLHYRVLAERSEAGGRYYFSGTVQDGQLVVRAVYSASGTYSSNQMARFAPDATSRSWHAVDDDDIHPSDTGTMVAAWGRIFVHQGYQATGFELSDSGLVSTGKFVTWFWPPWAQWGVGRLIRHPVGSGMELDSYRQLQIEAYGQTRPHDFIRLVMDEWYFYLPLAAARALGEARAYPEAEDWLSCVFCPYRTWPEERAVWAGLSMADDPESPEDQGDLAWQRDPFDPHAIARSRRSAYLRHAIYQYVENLLEWAEVEFLRDTRESLARARELYELADDLLHLPEMPQNPCEAAWRELAGTVNGAHSSEQVRILQLLLAPVRRGKREATPDGVRQLAALVRQDLPFAERAVAIQAAVAALPAQQPTEFRVPENPMLAMLRWRIESNLAKIRTGRNFAGLRRAMPAFAAAADPLALVQQSAADESLEVEVPGEPPSIYRFSYLIERARYFVSVAQQLESLLLASFEKGDAAEYDLMKARQDLRAARANIALQSLRVQEASDGVTLAQLQKQRSEMHVAHFTELVESGLTGYEQAAISELWQAHDWSIAAAGVQGAAAAAGIVVGAITGSATGGPLGTALGSVLGGIVGAASGLGSFASALSSISSVHGTKSQIYSMRASFERRAQEWQFQRNIAQQDTAIGDQGITLASDRLAIAQQEQAVAQLHGEFAAEVVNFLSTKFTNKQLYAWMARVVRRYYREHLSFATVLARMAQTALAFERQEVITYIAPHYAEREKNDLLAAERLLTDINRLDHHRLTTERRRKELTKTISLANDAPVEFQRLRSEGWMTFATLMEWFDRDFPGHYLRLIKSVSLTVVGLIPPSSGIKATLSNPGISRVMVGPPFDRLTEIQRQPESISVTATSNGTGLFEMRFDDPILLPFEGSGVETIWTLEMPKAANRFDYGTLADVLLTIHYTALEHRPYRDQVVARLGNVVERMSSFGMRTSFADAWYELHNPVFDAPGAGGSSSLSPYTLEFELRERDFAPNEKLQAMRRLNLAFRQKHFVKVPVEVEFIPQAASGRYRVSADVAWDQSVPETAPLSIAEFSHRQTDDGAWVAEATPLAQLEPVGRWRIRLRNELDPAQYPGLFSREPPVDGQRRLDLDWLEDALFVVTYQASVEYRFAP